MAILKKLSPVFICAFVVFALIGGVANAQGLKIGFVRDDVIKQQYSAWQRAQEQWELESKAWDEQALGMQQEIEDLLAEYDKQKLILSEEKKREKEAAIRAKQESLDAYTRQIYGPNGTAEKKNAALLEPLLQRATAAIEAVAIEGEYDVIFTLQSGLGYIKESYDVTDKVLEYLEKEEQ